MIFLHILIGALITLTTGNIFFLIGSIFPDIDHLYIIIKNRLFLIKKIKDSIKFEKKYKIRYKTPFFHSLLGLIIFSLIIWIFSRQSPLIFSMGYFLHLLLDWLDIDEKYYLFPLKIKFKGFLPIWSVPEKVATIILILLIIFRIFY